jgi:hypothetical protein
VIVVVADTSPLNYLIQIDCDYLLPALYQPRALPLISPQSPRLVDSVYFGALREPGPLSERQ